MSASGSYSSDEVRRTAKAREPDRYLSALLAPRAASDDLMAFAALGAEAQKIVAQSSEPAVGEIRIQWVRDALAAAERGANTGNPIVDAAGAALHRRSAPESLTGGLLDALTHRLYAGPPSGDAALNAELDLIEGAQFRLALAALGVAASEQMDSIVADAARSYGLVRLGLDLPISLARGRMPLPVSWLGSPAGSEDYDWRRAIAKLCAESKAALERCRARLREAQTPVIPAFLPLAVVEPYLTALQRGGFDPARDVAEISPLSRAWRIGRAAALQRI